MVKNENSAGQILEMVGTLNQAAVQLHDMIVNNKEDSKDFIQLMLTMLSKMEAPLGQLAEEEPVLMSGFMCRNVRSSLLNIVILKETEPERACRKIEFELIPLINELYVDLYFWGFCYPDQKKMWNYYRSEMPQLCPLPYVENSEQEGTYQYEVSIVVVAYNKLDYSKMCLNYLKKYFPVDVSHELILVNNGSDDGTKEFFESVHPEKQIDIQYNTKSFSVVGRIIEGKYVLFISNDVLITPHAVENMLRCIKSDEKIGCVVPTCPNIANLQTIAATYADLDGLVEFSEKNNQSDPYRWEQRFRLNAPILLARSNSEAFYAYAVYTYPFFPERYLAFSDDLMSLVVRRNGMKNILVKDAYVHHFGSITVNKMNNTVYKNGRELFRKTFGIDPWGTGFCFDLELIQTLNFSETQPINILGVNCGMGSNPLKIKEELKEKVHNTEVKIYNISDEKNYANDLRSLSDVFWLTDSIRNSSKLLAELYFHYIVIENEIEAQKNPIKIINQLHAHLSSGGIMAIKYDHQNFCNSIKGLYKQAEQGTHWILIKG